MDALIINPNSVNLGYQNLGRHLSAIEPPIWAAMLANYLRRQNYEVAILDAEAEGLSIEEAARRSADCQPRLFVITVYGHHPSASTENMVGAGLLARALKTAGPTSKIVLVGGHVSALPVKTLAEEAVDFVCQGEGPYTLNGLLSVNLNDGGELSKVPGLWYRREGLPVYTFPAPLIPREHLAADLPGMAFDLLPMDKYRAHNWHCFGSINQRQPYASLYTSLGCPFGCHFCCINALYGRPSYRCWDPDFMLDQFDLLANRYNVRNIKIADEMFVLNEHHFLRLCQLLAERDYDFNIWAYTRVDTVKSGYLKALKAAGINWLSLGIESGSGLVRDGVRKGGFDQRDIHQVVEQIRDEGINIMGNFIFGLPDDNYDTMMETLNLALELKCEMVNFYSAMAYPGSALYNLAIKNNWPLPESWLGYSQYAYETRPLPTRHLTSGQVLAFRDYAWKTYFTDSSYLAVIKAKFGPETCEHITAMTGYTLPRKFADPAFLSSKFV